MATKPPAKVSILIEQLRKNIDSIQKCINTLSDTADHDVKMDRLSASREAKLTALRAAHSFALAELSSQREREQAALVVQRERERVKAEEEKRRELEALMERQRREDEEREKKTRRLMAEREQKLRDEDEKWELEREMRERDVLEELEREMEMLENETERVIEEGKKRLELLDEERRSINAQIEAALAVPTVIPEIQFRSRAKTNIHSPRYAPGSSQGTTNPITKPQQETVLSAPQATKTSPDSVETKATDPPSNHKAWWQIGRDTAPSPAKKISGNVAAENAPLVISDDRDAQKLNSQSKKVTVESVILNDKTEQKNTADFPTREVSHIPESSPQEFASQPVVLGIKNISFEVEADNVAKEVVLESVDLDSKRSLSLIESENPKEKDILEPVDLDAQPSTLKYQTQDAVKHDIPSPSVAPEVSGNITTRVSVKAEEDTIAQQNICDRAPVIQGTESDDRFCWKWVETSNGSVQRQRQLEEPSSAWKETSNGSVHKQLQENETRSLLTEMPDSLAKILSNPMATVLPRTDVQAQLYWIENSNGSVQRQLLEDDFRPSWIETLSGSVQRSLQSYEFQSLEFETPNRSIQSPAHLPVKESDDQAQLFWRETSTGSVERMSLKDNSVASWVETSNGSVQRVFIPAPETMKARPEYYWVESSNGSVQRKLLEDNLMTSWIETSNGSTQRVATFSAEKIEAESFGAWLETSDGTVQQQNISTPQECERVETANSPVQGVSLPVDGLQMAPENSHEASGSQEIHVTDCPLGIDFGGEREETQENDLDRMMRLVVAKQTSLIMRRSPIRDQYPKLEQGLAMVTMQTPLNSPQLSLATLKSPFNSPRSMSPRPIAKCGSTTCQEEEIKPGESVEPESLDDDSVLPGKNDNENEDLVVATNPRLDDSQHRDVPPQAGKDGSEAKSAEIDDGCGSVTSQETDVSPTQNIDRTTQGDNKRGDIYQLFSTAKSLEEPKDQQFSEPEQAAPQPAPENSRAKIAHRGSISRHIESFLSSKSSIKSSPRNSVSFTSSAKGHTDDFLNKQRRRATSFELVQPIESEEEIFKRNANRVRASKSIEDLYPELKLGGSLSHSIPALDEMDEIAAEAEASESPNRMSVNEQALALLESGSATSRESPDAFSAFGEATSEPAESNSMVFEATGSSHETGIQSSGTSVIHSDLLPGKDFEGCIDSDSKSDDAVHAVAEIASNDQGPIPTNLPDQSSELDVNRNGMVSSEPSAMDGPNDILTECQVRDDETGSWVLSTVDEPGNEPIEASYTQPDVTKNSDSGSDDKRGSFAGTSQSLEYPDQQLSEIREASHVLMSATSTPTTPTLGSDILISSELESKHDVPRTSPRAEFRDEIGKVSILKLGLLEHESGQPDFGGNGQPHDTLVDRVTINHSRSFRDLSKLVERHSVSLGRALDEEDKNKRNSWPLQGFRCGVATSGSALREETVQQAASDADPGTEIHDDHRCQSSDLAPQVCNLGTEQGSEISGPSPDDEDPISSTNPQEALSQLENYLASADTEYETDEQSEYDFYDSDDDENEQTQGSYLEEMPEYLYERAATPPLEIVPENEPLNDFNDTYAAHISSGFFFNLVDTMRSSTTKDRQLDEEDLASDPAELALHHESSHVRTDTADTVPSMASYTNSDSVPSTPSDEASDPFSDEHAEHEPEIRTSPEPNNEISSSPPLQYESPKEIVFAPALDDAYPAHLSPKPNMECLREHGEEHDASPGEENEVSSSGNAESGVSTELAATQIEIAVAVDDGPLVESRGEIRDGNPNGTTEDDAKEDTSSQQPTDSIDTDRLPPPHPRGTPPTSKMELPSQSPPLPTTPPPPPPIRLPHIRIPADLTTDKPGTLFAKTRYVFESASPEGSPGLAPSPIVALIATRAHGSSPLRQLQVSSPAVDKTTAKQEEKVDERQPRVSSLIANTLSHKQEGKNDDCQSQVSPPMEISSHNQEGNKGMLRSQVSSPVVDSPLAADKAIPKQEDKEHDPQAQVSSPVVNTITQKQEEKEDERQSQASLPMLEKTTYKPEEKNGEPPLQVSSSLIVDSASYNQEEKEDECQSQASLPILEKVTYKPEEKNDVPSLQVCSTVVDTAFHDQEEKENERQSQVSSPAVEKATDKPEKKNDVPSSQVCSSVVDIASHDQKEKEDERQSQVSSPVVEKATDKPEKKIDVPSLQVCSSVVDTASYDQEEKKDERQSQVSSPVVEKATDKPEEKNDVPSLQVCSSVVDTASHDQEEEENALFIPRSLDGSGRPPSPTFVPSSNLSRPSSAGSLRKEERPRKKSVNAFLGGLSRLIGAGLGSGDEKDERAYESLLNSEDDV